MWVEGKLGVTEQIVCLAKAPAVFLFCLWYRGWNPGPCRHMPMKKNLCEQFTDSLREPTRSWTATKFLVLKVY